MLFREKIKVEETNHWYFPEILLTASPFPYAKSTSKLLDIFTNQEKVTINYIESTNDTRIIYLLICLIQKHLASMAVLSLAGKFKK